MTEQAVFTTEEKEGLVNDLNAIGQLLASHDQSIFQLIAAVNVIQKTLVDAGSTNNDALKAAMKQEVERLQAVYVKKVEEAAAKAEAQAG